MDEQAEHLRQYDWSLAGHDTGIDPCTHLINLLNVRALSA